MRLGRVVAYLLIGLGAVVMMLPFYWMVITAVSPAPDIIAFPPKWIPSHLTLDHFREAAAKAPWLLYYKNSLVVATASVGLSVLFGLFAGYAFAVYKFPLQNFSFLLILGTLMVPSRSPVSPCTCFWPSSTGSIPMRGSWRPTLPAPSACSSSGRRSRTSPWI